MTDHIPVLAQEVCEHLLTNLSGCYMDLTFGRGGHSRMILAQLDDQATLLACDRDAAASPDSLRNDSRFTFRHDDYAGQCAHYLAQGYDDKIDGILMDCGVSSPQLDEAERGFSFKHDGPLDMRMDQRQTLTADTWLAAVDAYDLTTVLRQYADERYAKRIANAIVKRREAQPITRTSDLAALVASVLPKTPSRIHPATRTFQAIRMAVNDELGQLAKALLLSYQLLRCGGRLVVIGFHGAENRVIKAFIQAKTPGNESVSLGMHTPPKIVTMKRVAKVKPSANECQHNPRARSAVMYVVEKVA